MSVIVGLGILATVGGCQNEQHSQVGPWPVVRCVAFSPDGKIVAAATTYLDEAITGELVMYDVASGNKINTFKGFNDWLMSTAFSPDGKTVATGSYDQGLGIWDLTTGMPNTGFGQQAERVTSVCFSPDGKTVASGDLSGTIVFWDVSNGTQRFTVVHDEAHGFKGVNCVAYSPNGKILASAGSGTVRIWNAGTGKEIACLNGHDPYQVHCVTFSHDSKFLATASLDTMVKIWNLETFQEVKSIKNLDAIYSVAFSPNDKTLLFGSEDRKITLWDLSAGQNLGTFEGHTNAVYDAKFSPDGTMLASASHDQTARIWNVSTLKPITVLRPMPSK